MKYYLFMASLLISSETMPNIFNDFYKKGSEITSQIKGALDNNPQVKKVGNRVLAYSGLAITGLALYRLRNHLQIYMDNTIKNKRHLIQFAPTLIAHSMVGYLFYCHFLPKDKPNQCIQS